MSEPYTSCEEYGHDYEQCPCMEETCTLRICIYCDVVREYDE